MNFLTKSRSGRLFFGRFQAIQKKILTLFLKNKARIYRMKTTFRVLCTLIFLVLTLLCGSKVRSQSIEAKDILDPKKICPSCYVSDQDNLLDEQTETKINSMLDTLYRKTTAQVAVVVINGNEDCSARDLSMELFDLWKVGQKGSDNGLIILLCVKARDLFMRTGYGLEGALTDSKATEIFQETMAPLFKKGDWSGGMLSGVERVCSVIYDEYEQNGFAPKEPADMSTFNTVYAILCGVFLVLALVFISRSGSKINPKYKVDKIRRIKKHSIGWIVVGFVFLPSLIVLLICIYGIIIPGVRRKKIVCECGAKMKLLSEAEEDQYLDEVKQLEETLGSKNYDVWLCDKCHSTFVYSYDKTLSSYQECPSCKAKTYHKKYEKVVSHATALQDGLMKTVYECENCHHKGEKLSVIPKAPPVIVAGGGGGISKGGGFSGGWGGGFSGGGGGGGKF